MYMSMEERKRMQKIFEDAAATTTIGDEKKFFLKILSLIYEINDKNMHTSLKYNANVCCDGSLSCFKKFIQSIVNTFSGMNVPETVDEVFMKDVATLAENLSLLSSEINKLSSILSQLHAKNKGLKPPALFILQ